MKRILLSTSFVVVMAATMLGVAPALAKVTGTHSGGKCNVTDSAGVTASVTCGGGVGQAACYADGSCSVGARRLGSTGVKPKGAKAVDDCVAYPERCKSGWN